MVAKTNSAVKSGTLEKMKATDQETNSGWYFAYGSNMLSDVFVARRKIRPLRSEPACIKSHALSFSIMGIPYSDPAMAGIRPIESGHGDTAVFGVAYLLTHEDKTIVLQSVIITRSYERLPSERYLGLLIRGSHEHSLPAYYQSKLATQATFKPLESWRYRTGKWLFSSFWQRVAYWIEKGVHKFKGSDGCVPQWFLMIFDCLLWTMWLYHDFIHCHIWGRGDGR